MRLNLQTDYALRVLIHVGTKGDRRSTIPEIARAFGISRAHLMKVVHRLGQLGYLETLRGRDGGLRLGTAPEQVSLGAVVRAMEQDLAVVGCLGAPGFCRIDGACRLKGALAEATAAFLATLDRTSLADLLAPRARLAEALGIAAA